MNPGLKITHNPLIRLNTRFCPVQNEAFSKSKISGSKYLISNFRSFEELCLKLRELSQFSWSHHIILVFEGFRFCLGFYLKLQSVFPPPLELEKMMRDHPDNQISHILKLFLEIYKTEEGVQELEKMGNENEVDLSAIAFFNKGKAKSESLQDKTLRKEKADSIFNPFRQIFQNLEVQSKEHSTENLSLKKDNMESNFEKLRINPVDLPISALTSPKLSNALPLTERIPILDLSKSTESKRENGPRNLLDPTSLLSELDQIDFESHENLGKTLANMNENEKKCYYDSNRPDFVVSNSFACLVNNLIVEQFNPLKLLDFDLLIYNANETLDRSKANGSSRQIKLWG